MRLPELLASAKFPVILCGGGVVMADGQPEAVRLAELLQAPVANSYLHNDSFPAKHPLWVGPLGYQGSKAAMTLIAKADVVLALGTRLGPFGTLPQYGMEYWPKDAKIIQVDADAKMLGLVKSISVGICGDAKAAAQALVERLSGRTLASIANKDARLAEIAATKKWLGSRARRLGAREGRVVARSVEELDVHASAANAPGAREGHARRAMVSTDIGNICSVSNSYLRFNRPRSMLAAMSFGNCGYAFPTVVGAKVAAPDRPAIAYVGDGAWGMSFGEIQTCVRENIPVTAVVFNNGQWGAEKKNHVDFYENRFVGVNLDQQPSWAKVAQAMGAEGHTIDKLADVGPALRAAAKAQGEGKTTILEMMVTRELGDPFRRDALALPTRHLAKYQSTAAKRR
jgi:sulfoacetaldehyde acetyltransferase